MVPRLRMQAGLALALGFWATAGAAQSPVAIVEEIDSRTAGVEFMDYLFPGQVIRLEGTGTMVVSYLKSCWREKVVAGTVRVGEEQSEVEQGEVQRTKFPCGSGHMQLSSEQAKQSGGFTMRAARPRREGRRTGEPDLPVVHDCSPVLELQRPGRLVVERIDRPEARTELEVAADELLRGSFLDLARRRIALTPGAVYRARHEGREVIFKIAPGAEAKAASIAVRLVRFPAAGAL